jgi:hypothetical protein
MMIFRRMCSYSYLRKEGCDKLYAANCAGMLCAPLGRVGDKVYQTKEI